MEMNSNGLYICYNKKKMKAWEASSTYTSYASEDEEDGEETRRMKMMMMAATWPPRSYRCTFCKREFRSAQALGGHMNVHRRDRAQLRQLSFLNNNPNNTTYSINLNLPPPCTTPNYSTIHLDTCSSSSSLSPPSSMITMASHNPPTPPPPPPPPPPHDESINHDVLTKKENHLMISLNLEMNVHHAAASAVFNKDLDLELRLGYNY